MRLSVIAALLLLLSILGMAMQPSEARQAVYQIEGLSHQLELWRDDTDFAQIAMVGPLGCGKTYGLAIKQALLRSVNRDVDGMLVVPTFRMAKRVHVPEWPKILERVGIAIRHEASNNAFLWPWGTRTWIGTAEDPERLAGPNLGDVTFDEPGQMPREAFERGAGRSRHAQAKVRQVVLGGTPEGINWFADLFAEPKGNRRTIWARTWHRTMSHYPGQLVELYGYDESLLATYAGGKFVPLRVGRAWRFYDAACHLREPRYEPSIPLVLACDFNVDAMRWEIGQFTPREIHWLDEIALGRDGSTEAAAREFVRRWGNGRHTREVIVTGDAAGQARSTSGRTDYQVIQEELGRGRFESASLRIPPANPRVKDRVDNTNYHLSGRGRNVTVSERCKELRRDWERCAWKQGTAELDKRDAMRTHAAEAADYATWQLARVIGMSASVVPAEAEDLPERWSSPMLRGDL